MGQTLKGISKTSLLTIGIGFISSGVGLIPTKPFEGTITTLIGFGVLFYREKSKNIPEEIYN